jgi:hypothetical protein
MFRLLSKAGAVVTDSMLEYHESSSFKVFSLLDTIDVIPALLAIPECMQDQFAKHVLATHRQDMSSDLLRHKLACAACLVRLDIANIEIGHGRLRRRILNASNNTWRSLLDNASASWVLQEFERRRRDVSLVCGLNAPSAAQNPQQQDPMADDEPPSRGCARAPTSQGWENRPEIWGRRLISGIPSP